MVKLGENSMHGHNIRIQTVNSRGIQQVVMEPPKPKIPPTPQVIGYKPPKISDHVRPPNPRYAVPDDLGKINLFYPLAIRMDFVIAS